MATMPNPLSWPGATGTNNPTGGAAWNVGAGTSPFAGAGVPPFNTGSIPGGGTIGTTPIHPSQINNQLGAQNLISQQYRNALLPQFANSMFGLAGPAASFFQQLMNLGSPYYQQQQRSSFEQGVGQGQNAAAGSRQGLAARGYGSAPSGLEAGMMGQEATGQAQNLSQLFLQNLFQNEAMQMQGAQGMAGMASLFNPSQMMPGSSPVPYSPSFWNQLTQGIGAMMPKGNINIS